MREASARAEKKKLSPCLLQVQQGLATVREAQARGVDVTQENPSHMCRAAVEAEFKRLDGLRKKLVQRARMARTRGSSVQRIAQVGSEQPGAEKHCGLDRLEGPHPVPRTLLAPELL